MKKWTTFISIFVLTGLLGVVAQDGWAKKLNAPSGAQSSDATQVLNNKEYAVLDGKNFPAPKDKTLTEKEKTNGIVGETFQPSWLDRFCGKEDLDKGETQADYMETVDAMCDAAREGGTKVKGWLESKDSEIKVFRIDTVDLGGHTLLDMAINVKAQHTATIKYLLKFLNKGATKIRESKYVKKNGQIQFRGNNNAWKYLRNDPKRYINFPDKNGRTALWHAVFWGHDEIVKLLLENGAEVDLTALPKDIQYQKLESTSPRKLKDNVTILMEGVKKGNLAIVDMLLTKKPDLLAQDKSGHTAFHYAIKSERNDILGNLLDSCKGDCVNGQYGQSKNTLTMFAVQRGNQEIVKTVLSKTPNLLLKNNIGVTALHMVAKRGNIDIATALVEACGENVAQCLNARSNDGSTPWMTATINHQMALAAYLESAGAIITDEDRKTAERAAANQTNG